jgi:imidazolonepropionase-like amidohydrolase
MGIQSKFVRFTIVALATIIILCLVYSMSLQVGRYTPESNAPDAVFIQNVKFWDGKKHGLDSGHILIRADHIECIGKRCLQPSDALEVDGRGLTAIPGLIDLHIHFFAPVGDDTTSPVYALKMPLWEAPRQRPQVRRAFLKHGVTSVRGVGSIKDLELKLRDKIAAGELLGPRFFAAGPIFTAVGGHPASTFYRGIPPLQKMGTRQLEDPHEAILEVRRLHAQGFDGVKIVYEGLSRDGVVVLPQLNEQAMRSISAEANALGMWVAIHTGNLEDMRAAVEAGATTIEHGLTRPNETPDEALLSLMKERGTILVPTLAVAESATKGAIIGEGLSEALDEAELGRDEVPNFGEMLKQVKMFADAGIPIGAGTDTLGETMAYGPSLIREIELISQAGLTNREALMAATSVATTALKEPNVGTLKTGNFGDLLLLNGNPLEDLNTLHAPALVISRGRIVGGSMQ